MHFLGKKENTDIAKKMGGNMYDRKGNTIQHTENIYKRV